VQFDESYFKAHTSVQKQRFTVPIVVVDKTNPNPNPSDNGSDNDDNDDNDDTCTIDR